MNPTPLRHDPPAGGAEDPAAPATGSPADPDVLRLRGVHRATADLRRGTPVLLEAAPDLVLLTAETAGARGLGEFQALAGGPAMLLLAPVRAAAVLHRPVPPNTAALALRLPEALFDPAFLRSLADPTAEQVLPAEPVLAPECPAAAPAALALAKLARLLPAVLAAPAAPDAAARAASLRLQSVPAADVLAYPVALAAALVRVAEAQVPLDGAPDARIVAFRAPDAGVEHLAILVGRPEEAEAPLVRLHSECFTGDLLGSLRCDCGPQLRGAIRRMAEEGAGVLLYLAQEGRGIGLVNKLRAYALQDRGLDTVDANRALGWGADERNFLVAATMLEALGVRRLRLLTNNPDKVAALAACGVTVLRRESHAFAPNGINDHYLATKAERFGHLLE
ncbi:GTP cyclohydrolase-2 [Rhodovastum atsumiense]|uniref:GTP cyclohydrolase-2 n=1 Tax=Rhodovastum atsumiense TaxID=504468 RepID=A0A5M6IW25_9PROT|nr:GTP cyclohydrolase II [Rhodovastum atsumiense]KAA5612530.1 GTP cyclohydrolase II [Rhodovastum atsumiense]CAH2601391.1 GTP cyclohydrolase-2 [Rhodovastum atsumiense]